MSGTNSPQGRLTRRSFLKTTAAVAGAAALAGGASLTSLADAEDNASGEEVVYSGLCRGNCFQECALNMIVRDGYLVRTEAQILPKIPPSEDDYSRICLKGHTLPQRIYRPDRILYPMKRVEGTERGAGEWERISWDDAIETIASTWKRLLEEYGSMSIAFSQLAGNWCLSRKNFDKLRNAMGIPEIGMGVDQASGAATVFSVGSGSTFASNDVADMVNSKTVVFWGANITNSQIQEWHFCADAKEAGATLVTIDPNYKGIAAKSDIHIPLRPCTDGVLAMAAMNVVIENGWEDVEFLKKNSVAPLLVKASDGKYLRESDLGGEAGDQNFIVWDEDANEYAPIAKVANPALHGTFEIEGIAVTTAFDLLIEKIEKYTPEYAADLCDLSVEQIEKVADLFANNGPCFTYITYGFDRYANAYYSYFAIQALSIITGNFCKHGASSGFYRPQLVWNSEAVSREGMPGTGPSLSPNVLPEIVESGKCADVDVPLKSILFFTINYLSSHSDPSGQIEMLNQMELVVVNELYMTDTARYADIILPVCEWPETVDIGGTSTLYPFQVIQEKALEPAGESKSDFEIANLLAHAMGFEEWFDITQEEFLEELIGASTWAALKTDKAVPLSWYKGEPFVLAEDGAFTTATGKAQFYLETPTPGVGGELYYGQTYSLEKIQWPYWEPPLEAWHENELFEKYPLICFAEHIKWRTQTQFGHVPMLRELDPWPQVLMSEIDARERGISNGDEVRVFNDRASVTVRAVIDNGHRPGMCCIPRGWQYDHFIEGHANDLASRAMNPNIANDYFSDTLVQIEKA